MYLWLLWNLVVHQWYNISDSECVSFNYWLLWTNKLYFLQKKWIYLKFNEVFKKFNSFVGTLWLLMGMHLALRKYLYLYRYTCFSFSCIGTLYITELSRLGGPEYFNTLALTLFAFIASLILNFSTGIQNSTICMGASLVYYILRLGFHFNDFSVSFSALILISGAFYLVNQLFFEISKKKEKVLIQKFATLSLSMWKLLDYLPYPVLIETQGKILVFNKKLIDLLEIDEKGVDITAVTESKLKRTIVEIGNLFNL